MPNTFKKGVTDIQRTQQGYALLLARKKIHAAQQTSAQRNGLKASKKAPEGAFESAPYPGLKESTEVESVHITCCRRFHRVK